MNSSDEVVDIPLTQEIQVPAVQHQATEEAWNERSESLAMEWQEKAQKCSDAHNKTGLAKKKMHVIFGLPAVLIPAIMSPMSIGFADEPGIEYGNMTGFILTAICSGVHTFFGYSKLHQKHMDFSARYADVVSDIKYELIKGRSYRQPADAFLMKIQLKMDMLCASGPDL